MAVPLLENNKQFQAVSILNGTLTQDRTWKPMGTATTAGMYYLFNSSYTVQAGATLTVALGTVIVVDAGGNGTTQRITVNGTLVMDHADSMTFVRRVSAIQSLTVNGTLTATNTRFGQNVVDSRGILSLDVSAGGHMTAASTEFTLPTVSLADGSVLNAGDLTGNTFNTTLFVSGMAVPLLENNKQFQAVSILNGTLTQDRTWKPMGTATTAGMYYLFNSSYTVQAGATLTVAPGTVIVVDAGGNGTTQRITINGTLVMDHADSMTFVRRVSAIQSLTVNGTLTATNTRFGQNVVDSRGILSLDVSAGGHMTAASTEFTLPTVSLADGSVLNAGDLTNNQFNTTLVVPVAFVPLLDANRSFNVVSIRAGTLASSMTWKPLGTDTTANMSFALNGPFKVANGVTLTVAPSTALTVLGDLTVDPTASMLVGQDARLVVDAGGNGTTQRITVNGTLAMDHADSMTFVRRVSAIQSLTVNGTLTATNTRFGQNVLDSRGILSLDVSAGGHMTAANTEFTLPTVSLADGSVLNAGDLTGNTFNTTLFVSGMAVPLLENNKQFQAVSILNGTLTQDRTWKPMGTATTAGMYYLFNSSYTVQAGATLTVALGTVIVVDAGGNGTTQRITVNGTLVMDHADSMTFVRRVSAIQSLTVNGTLTATNTRFGQNVVDSRGILSLDVSAGGHMTAASTEFTLPTVSLADGSVLNAGDLTGNTFNTTLFVSGMAVPLLENNKQFQAVSILNGTLTQDRTWKPMGTATTAGMYYLFNSSYTVQAGATLTVAPGTVMVVDAGGNGTTQRITINGTLVMDHADSMTFVRRVSAIQSLTVNGTLTATNTRFGQSVVDSRGILSLDVSAGGQIGASNSLFDLPTVSMATGSIGSVRLSTLKTNLQIVGPSAVEIKYNTLADATVVATGDAASTIDMRQNWWGTTDPAVIENKITHKPDLSTRPTVDFSGYLLGSPQVPDLAIQGFSIESGDSLVPGGTYTVHYQVTNSGTAAITTGTAVVFYLSTGGDLTNPLLLGIGSTPPLAGASSSGVTSFTFTVPGIDNPWWNSRQPGVFKLTALADALNQVVEASENNNSSSLDVTVAFASAVDPAEQAYEFTVGKLPHTTPVDVGVDFAPSNATIRISPSFAALATTPDLSALTSFAYGTTNAASMTVSALVDSAQTVQPVQPSLEIVKQSKPALQTANIRTSDISALLSSKGRRVGDQLEPKRPSLHHLRRDL